MKSFFKILLASIIGLSIAMIISLLILTGIISGALSENTSTTFSLQNNSILLLKLEGILEERVETNPINELLAFSNTNTHIGLDQVLSAIKKAQNNDKIRGIYLETKSFVASPASAQAIHKALQDFKKSNKFIIAYGDVYTQQAYYIASAADTLILNPQGSIYLSGLSITPTYYKTALDKLGVEMQIFKVGTYKSAVEPFTFTKMSSENRQQLSEYLQDTWSTISTDIANNRHLSTENLNHITDIFPPLLPQDSIIALKLADTLMYQSEVKQYLRRKLSIKENDPISYASVSEMCTVPEEKNKNRNTKDKIAILYASGDITSGNGYAGITDQRMIKEIEKIAEDENIKALVLRVNSPGGSAYASEQIWKALTELKQKKPIVASMSDYAASGGYYIACNANQIFAEPTTLTGSIGIFGMFPNIQGLTHKIGLSFDNVKTNKFSDFGDITRPMTGEEKQVLQQYVNRGYEIFIQRCAQGRNMTIDKIKELAQGRIYSGNQALKVGLVDSLGGLEQAIEAAAKLAQIENYRTVTYPAKKSIWDELFSTGREEIRLAFAKEYFGENFNLIQIWKEIQQQDHIQAIFPYKVSIK